MPAREIKTLAAYVAAASLKHSDKWLRLFDVDEDGVDLGGWVELDRARTPEQYRVHVERCIRDALEHDDFRLLPPYLLERNQAGTNVTLHKLHARGFRKRLAALGLTLPRRGRPGGGDKLSAMVLEVLERDPDITAAEVAARMQLLFGAVVRVEPGARVRWAKTEDEAAAGIWNELTWASFRVKLSPLRAQARRERDGWR